MRRENDAINYYTCCDKCLNASIVMYQGPDSVCECLIYVSVLYILIYIYIWAFHVYAINNNNIKIIIQGKETVFIFL